MHGRTAGGAGLSPLSHLWLRREWERVWGRGFKGCRFRKRKCSTRTFALSRSFGASPLTCGEAQRGLKPMPRRRRRGGRPRSPAQFLPHSVCSIDMNGKGGFVPSPACPTVIPAKAGIQYCVAATTTFQNRTGAILPYGHYGNAIGTERFVWIPAFAGMTYD